MAIRKTLCISAVLFMLFQATVGQTRAEFDDNEQTVRHNTSEPAARREAAKVQRESPDDKAKKNPKPNDLPSTDLSDVEKRTDELLAQIRHGNEREQSAAAKRAIALVEQLHRRQAEHYDVNAPWKDFEVEPKVVKLHLRAGAKCETLAIELSHAIYLNAPKCPSAADAVSWLERYARGDHKVAWCNVLIREYPGKRDFDAYTRLGHDLAGIGRNDEASKAFLKSFLLDDNVSHWDDILSHDARLADPAFVAKLMPEAAKEFARRTKEANVRLSVALVSTVSRADRKASSDKLDILPGEYRVTAEYATPSGRPANPLRNVALRVLVLPNFRRNIQQCMPFFGDSTLWESDLVTLEPGKSVSRTFTISKCMSVDRGRPIALLAYYIMYPENVAKDAKNEGVAIWDLPAQAKQDLPFWSQPLLVTHLILSEKDRRPWNGTNGESRR